MTDQSSNLLEILEQVTDYAAMIKGCMQQLQDAGLSQYGAEAVLLSLLGIPGYEPEDFDD